jgi:hypothetical protein
LWTRRSRECVGIGRVSDDGVPVLNGELAPIQIVALQTRRTAMMNGFGGMGWGTGLTGLVVLAALVLGIAALVKFLRK